MVVPDTVILPVSVWANLLAAYHTNIGGLPVGVVCITG